MRELRADSYLHLQDISKAVNDLKATAKLIPDNTHAFLQISLMLYSMGDADDSLAWVYLLYCSASIASCIFLEIFVNALN